MPAPPEKTAAGVMPSPTSAPPSASGPGRGSDLATPSHRRTDLSAADMLYAKELLSKKSAFIIDCDGVL